MSQNLSFRPVETADRDFLLTLFASAREKELEAINWDNNRRQAFLTMQFDAQQTHYQRHFPEREHQIILLDNRLIGMTDIVRTAEEIRVLDIILRPENRNFGIGTGLIRDLLAEADGSGKPVRLYVEKFNPAQRLYARFGFTIIDDTGVNYHMQRLPGQPRTAEKFKSKRGDKDE